MGHIQVSNATHGRPPERAASGVHHEPGVMIEALGGGMNSRGVLLAVAAVLAGCAPDFTGTYLGPLTASTTCDNGASWGSAPETFQWGVQDIDGVVSIVPQNGNCGTLTARAEGTSAIFAPKVCPTWTDQQGSVWTEKLFAGNLSLTGDRLSVDLRQNLTWTPPSPGSCDDTIVGTMIRQH